MADFTIDCFQNEYLPQGAQMMHAVLTITAAGTTALAAEAVTDRSELLIVDTSGSMNGKKLRSVKEATNAAIDCIPDGARFGIITGNHEAQVAFPTFPPLAVSSENARRDAKAEVKKFEARGGTAIGSWIELARYMLGDVTGIRHAILLTDGKNESEQPEELEKALERAEGVFQCDCRGVGDGWEVAELRKVANALLGELDIVAQPEDLAADFTRLIRQSLGKQLAEVSLRVWTPKAAEVVALKQLEPPLDLTASRVQSAPLAGDYATGSWGDERRDFHLTVRVPAGDVGDRMLAARVTLMAGDEPLGEGQVLAEWTDDTAKSTRLNGRVARAIGDAEFADEIDQAMDEWRAGDEERATGRLAKALGKAKETGNDAAADLVLTVVDEDPMTGRVKLKDNVSKTEMMTLETQSRRTSRNRRNDPPGGAPVGAP
jgi:hypothetical protein